MNSPKTKSRTLYVALGLIVSVAAITAVSHFATAEESVNGLNAEYFSDINLKNRKVARIDTNINFDWQTGSPAASLARDYYSARWTGFIIPRYSETYHFSTVSDDGIRVWVDDKKIIDNWTDHPIMENWGSIDLKAGTSYTIKVEYYENWGESAVNLSWTSISQRKEIIPQSQLTTSATVNISQPISQTPPPPTTTTATVSGVKLNERNWDFATNSWKTSGDWYNCDGSIDNDQAHHTTDVNDKDPSHHLGMYCDGTKEAWKQNINISVSSTQSITPSSSPQPITNIVPEVTASKTTVEQVINMNNSSNPFANAKLFVNPYNAPSEYVKSHSGTREGELMKKIADQPEVNWLGNWNSNISNDVSNMMNSHANQGALPVFVIYNIPNRDCGNYSAGGLRNESDYQNWINQIASAIGNRKAAMIIEPDALSLIDCLSSTELTARYNMLKYAVNKFTSQGLAVYLDAGHPGWISASEMAKRLKSAGVEQAQGFALNIANFFTNADNAAYGKQVSDLTGGKHFVVDTGRNGSGPTPDYQWCNPPGRSLGQRPTVFTGNSLIDAYLWIKGPGGSDGNCNGAPSAGTFWPEYALGLAERTNW